MTHDSSPEKQTLAAVLMDKNVSLVGIIGTFTGIVGTGSYMW